jgi:hypothetical protein
VESALCGIADRPTTGPWAERDDLLSNGRVAWVRGCLGVRQGGRFRRRLGAEGSRFGAAVDPASGGSSFDLGERNRPRGQKTKRKADPRRNATVAVSPTPNASRAGVKEPGDAAWCDAERAEHLAELDRGH